MRGGRCRSHWTREPRVRRAMQSVCFHSTRRWHELNAVPRTDGIANIDGAVATLVAAVKNALKEHLSGGVEPTESRWQDYLQKCFRSVWIGLAGLDRPGLHGELAPKLGKTFGLDHTTPNFRLSSDVDLLPAAVPASNESASVVVLVAGTGSVAMRYTWSEDRGYVRVARSGGWGHMLGDEAGGYSIGLEAIKHTLVVLEEITLGLRVQELGKLEDAIVKHFGCRTSEDGSIDLLSNVLSQHHAQSTKSRIADVAEAVLRLAPCDRTAMAIINNQILGLVNCTLSRLVDYRCTSYVMPEESELVLAGGLMRNEGYRTALQRQLVQRGLHFRGIRVVDDVAAVGVSYLARGIQRLIVNDSI